MLTRRQPLALVAAVGALALLGAAELALAQLVTNGEFDTNELGWSLANPDPLDNSWTWDSENASGAAGSGSARLANTQASAGEQAWVRQCVDLGPGAAVIGDYLLRFAAKIPSGQSETGRVFGQVTFYSVSGCNGAADIGLTALSPILYSSAAGDWYSIETVAPIGQLPASVRIAFFQTKNEAAGSFEVLLDQVRLDAGLLLLDGFESGDTTAWSSASP